MSLDQKITYWLSNHSSARDSRLPKALKTVWTGREVLNMEEDKAITARAAEICEETGKVPIAALNIARSETWNALSEEEQITYEDKAEQWTIEGPDPELRVAYALSYVTASLKPRSTTFHQHCRQATCRMDSGLCALGL